MTNQATDDSTKSTKPVRTLSNEAIAFARVLAIILAKGHDAGSHSSPNAEIDVHRGNAETILS